MSWFTRDYYVPRTKDKLIETLCLKWPEARNRFKKMGKVQLYAILYRVREDKP